MANESTNGKNDRVGNTVFDLWLPTSFLITYAMWLIEWYCQGEFKTVGDVFAGLVLAVIASAFSFWVIALALAIIAVPVVLLSSVISRLRNRK